MQDEFGFKTEFFNQHLAFNGAWFQIDQTNVTIPNPDHQTDPTAPEQLISDFGNKGFELELIGRVNEQLSILASYSNLKMRDSLGRHVRAVADNNAAILLNYRFTNSDLKGLALNFGVSYTSKRTGDTPPDFPPPRRRRPDQLLPAAVLRHDLRRGLQLEREGSHAPQHRPRVQRQR